VKRRECSRPTTTPAGTKFGSLEKKGSDVENKTKEKKGFRVHHHLLQQMRLILLPKIC
jgi:hypothetical protein